MALSSCEAEFMVATEAAKQAIWLQDLLSEVVGDDCKMVVIQVDNKSAIRYTYESPYSNSIQRNEGIHWSTSRV